MAGSSLGTIAGQIKLDASQALAAFAATKAATHESSSALEAASGKLKMFGGVATIMGGAMVAGFALAVNAAAKFDKQMSYIGAVTKATGSQMDQVRAKALQLGKDGQFSAGEIADGFVDLAKAGVSVNDMTGVMADSMVNLASASGVDLNESVETIVAQLHTYGLTAKDSVHVTNELAGTMHASVLSLSDVATTMKYAGAVAHGLGISYDQVSTATAIMGKAGIKGSSAGTQLRQIMVSLTGATKPARAELTSLGIMTKNGGNEFFDASGKAKSLAEVFQILQDHTKGLNQEQQLMAFRTIFNNRALAAAEILTKSGAAGFAEMNAQIGKTTAAEVATEKLNNLSGDIQKLRGSIDTMLIKAGEPMMVYMRDIVQFINKVVNAFVSLSPTTQKNIVLFLGIGGALLIFIGTLAIFAATILKVISVFREMYAAFKLVALGVRLFGLAFSEMSLALLTNPIFLIAVAVIALGVAFYEAYQHSKTFRDIIDAIGRGLKTGFMATIAWFEGLPKFFEGIWKDIEGWFDTGVNFIKAHWQLLVAIFTGPIGIIIYLVYKFKNQIIGFFQAIPGEVSRFLSSAMTAASNFLTNLPEKFGFAIGFILGYMARLVVEGYQYFTKLGVDVTNAVVNFFEKLPGEIWKWLNQMANNILKFQAESAADFKKWGAEVLNDVITFFEKLPGEVAKWLVNTYHNAINWFNQFNAATTHFATAVFNAVVNWFQKLPGRVANFFSTMYHGAVSWLSNLVTGAGNMASSVYHGFMNWIEKIPGAVTGAIGNAISAFKNMVGQALQAAESFAKGLWDGFKKGLGIHSPSYIERAMWQITDVTQAESTKLGKHVQTMQQMAGEIAETNPAKAASDTNTGILQRMTQNMKTQTAALQNAAVAIFGPQMASKMATTGVNGEVINPTSSATSLTTAGSGASILVNVYNPVAESAGDSTASKLRTLSAMGAF